uniref:Translation initiation factor IF-1, chloroplastic n=1 Tax=Dunaliella tertiolecta TaxID=3047 RepID=A0A7S3RAK2_DUNTE
MLLSSQPQHCLSASTASRKAAAFLPNALPTRQIAAHLVPSSLLWSPRPVSSSSPSGAAEPSGRLMDVTCRARPSAPAADSKSTPGPSRPAKKKSKKLVDINGEVVKDLGNGMFQIKLENGVGVMGHLSGKIRQNRIRIVTGDKVTVELSPYDLTRGRLTYRFKPGEYERMIEEQEAAASGRGSAASSMEDQ